MIYCISDIHGKRKEFYKMLNKINFNNEDTLYVLGDVIDKGDDGIALFEELNLISNVVMLKGNHEDMCYKAMTGEMALFRKWTNYNGGQPTYEALMKMNREKRYKTLITMNELPLYKIIYVNGKKYLLVHAGLYRTNSKTVEESLKFQHDNLLWIRELFYLKNFKHLDCTIVFGHTSTAMIMSEMNKKKRVNIEDSYIWEHENKIGIDCGASYGGRLACIRLDDLKKFYVEC